MTKILLCLKTNKLAFCGFMDVGGKPGTSGSLEKDAVTFEACGAFRRSHGSIFLLVGAYRVVLRNKI